MGQVEPQVGAGQVYFRQGFGHAPMNGINRAEEGETITVRVNALATGLYEQLSDCSSAINDEISNAIGISSTKETALTAQNSDNTILVNSAQALRTERNRIQLGIHGTRKVLTTINEEMDELESLQVLINDTTVSDVVQ